MRRLLNCCNPIVTSELSCDIAEEQMLPRRRTYGAYDRYGDVRTLTYGAFDQSNAPPRFSSKSSSKISCSFCSKTEGSVNTMP